MKMALNKRQKILKQVWWGFFNSLVEGTSRNPSVTLQHFGSQCQPEPVSLDVNGNEQQQKQPAFFRISQ